ncbi:MAG: hypothetical protein GC178_15175 [Flavobacteriales bacterium]|nr:hypothetical protein [Flavobacteriales bacterium]
MKHSISILFLIIPLFGMSQVDRILKEYKFSSTYLKHKLEAYQVHKELISGKVGPTLEMYLVDTLNADSSNLQYINEALASEQFKQHSARIDTHVTFGGTTPVNFTTMVAFRDIFYLGNDMFRRFMVNVSIHWDEKFQVTRREVHFIPRDVKSRESWTRGDWWSLLPQRFSWQ